MARIAGQAVTAREKKPPSGRRGLLTDRRRFSLLAQGRGRLRRPRRACGLRPVPAGDHRPTNPDRTTAPHRPVPPAGQRHQRDLGAGSRPPAGGWPGCGNGGWSLRQASAEGKHTGRRGIQDAYGAAQARSGKPDPGHPDDRRARATPADPPEGPPATPPPYEGQNAAGDPEGGGQNLPGMPVTAGHSPAVPAKCLAARSRSAGPTRQDRQGRIGPVAGRRQASVSRELATPLIRHVTNPGDRARTSTGTRTARVRRRAARRQSVSGYSSIVR